MKKEYRFECRIVDENDEEVLFADTFISSHISEFGECESVDAEVGKIMRNFRKKQAEDEAQMKEDLETFDSKEDYEMSKEDTTDEFRENLKETSDLNNPVNHL